MTGGIAPHNCPSAPLANHSAAALVLIGKASSGPRVQPIQGHRRWAPGRTVRVPRGNADGTVCQMRQRRRQVTRSDKDE
jgi:hypothetical protein